jgi:hypothetical protein
MKNQTLKKYTGKEVDEAIRWVHDLMLWSQIPCFLTGETLKQIKDEQNLNVEKIEIGVRKRHLTQDTTRLLQTFVPGVVIGKTINLTGSGVPIEVKVYESDSPYFEHPDFAYYYFDEYKVPNPWDKFYEERNSIT